MSEDLTLKKLKSDLVKCKAEFKKARFGTPKYFYYSSIKKYIEHTIRQMDKNK